MKTNLLFLFTFAFVFGCSTKPKTVEISLPAATTGMRTPTLVLPDSPDPGMKNAAVLFNAYANSEEFYAYLSNVVTSLEGGNESDVKAAIKKFRSCLNDTNSISIVWTNYSIDEEGKVIGGWRKTFLAQNPMKELDSIERASHWVHEISHACGFTHINNDIMKYPIIKRSWPYQVGNVFKDFLWKKVKK